MNKRIQCAFVALIICITACFLLFCKSLETEEAAVQETTEIAIPGEMETEPDILTFVDVHGNRYEMQVNPEVPANPYEKENFVRDGGWLSYEDNSYTSRIGVDVSYYQGDIDWEKAAASGISFAILRIGYRGYSKGSLNVDAKFQENREGAQRAGLDVGVYFFSQAVNEEEALEEARFVLDILNGEKLALPIVFDPEHVSDSDARTDSVSAEQFTRNAAAFCGAVEEAGYDAMIYSNLVWEAYWLDLKELAEYPVWYADYELLPQTPYAFEIWQYTENGEVDGITGKVDMDIQMMAKETDHAPQP